MSWQTVLQTLRAGNVPEAVLAAAALCQRSPENAMAWHVSGLALLEAGDPAAAVAPLRRAVSLAPAAARLRGPLGIALLRAGQAAQGRPHLMAAAAAGDLWARLHAGIAAFVLHDNADAVRILSALAVDAPQDPQVWRYLGLATLELGDLTQAATAWTQVSEQCPTDPEGPTMLGVVRGRAGDAQAAIQCFRDALRRDPSHVPAWSQLGAYLIERGELDAAAHAYEQAGDAVGLALLAERRRDLTTARTTIAPLVAAGTAPAAALDLWSRLCRRQGDPESALAPLRQALRQGRGLDRSVLLHALADTLDALGEVDPAWDAWCAANSARGLSFDPEAHSRMVADICAVWSRQAPPERTGPAGHAPVFIVGMPRSGTSLLEQMLDAHPALRGIGEREEIAALAAQLRGPAPDRDTAVAAASSYRAAVGEGRTVDKMPHNFYHLGLVRQLFPDARILYSVRDPVDVCFSCFRQRFGARMAYATDLDWLGAVYLGHNALMAHWSRIGIPILPVRYAALVRAPEETLRDVLRWLELPWDPGCLRFHERERTIATASFAQVQQPLYTHGVGRAAPYHSHLVRLRQALGKPSVEGDQPGGAPVGRGVV